MRGISAALIDRLRRPDPTAQIMVEGRIETAADLRQRFDQWEVGGTDGGLDALPGNVELLTDGGVRLKATGANGPANASHPSVARTLLDSGPPAAPYIDPLSPSGLNHINILNLAKARLAAVVVWSGTESTSMELTQIQAYLNPQYDLAVDKYVSIWRCDLYQLVAVTGQGQWTLRPIGAREVAASGQGAGWVKFDYSFDRVWGAARPLPKSGPLFAWFELGVVDVIAGPVTVALFSGLRGDRTPAKNISLGYDGTIASSVSADGSYLYGFGVNWDMAYNSPGRIYQYGTLGKVPSVQFTFGTHTAATVSFASAGNRLTLSPAPAASPEFIARGQTPAGTSLLYEVSTNAANWFPFTDGQTAADVGLATQAFYYMRATLTPNAAGDRSPILRALGVAEVAVTDLSDVCEVQTVAWAFDPLDHHAEIPELVLAAIHEGERDFQDVVSRFLSQQSIGTMSLRLWCGDRRLGRADWTHQDDFLIDDYDLAADRAYITGISPLALVRGALPILSDQAAAYPDSDVSNPGAWVDVGGSANLYQALADNNGGLGLVPWDDSTAIETPANPVNAAYTAGLQDVSPPAEPIVGQVLVQFRYKVSSGTSLTLACALMEGASVRASRSFTATSTTSTADALTPTVTELATIGDWTNLRVRFTVNGTGKVQVSWARLVILPTRPALTYSNDTPATVVEDLLSGQLGLAQRYRGPGLQGIDGLDTGTTLLIGKTIESPAGGSTDLTIAKQELDAVSFVAGVVHISSQGRIAARQLYEVTVAGDGVVTYEARTALPVLFIPKEELNPTSVRPGFQYRTPEFDVDWGFNASTSMYTGTAHGVSDVALASLGEARIVAVKRASETIAQWIQDQNTANGLSFRQVGAFGLGLLVWRFTTTYAYPELELGDVIAIETDRFLAYDPNAARAIAGTQWVAAVVSGIFDAWGRDFAVWVPGYASIGAASSGPPELPDPRGTGTADLIVNGNFEEQLTGWATSLAGAGISLESGGNVYLGTYSIRLDAQNLNSAVIVQPKFRVIPGSTIKVVGVGKILNGTARTAAVTLTFYGPDAEDLAAGGAVISWSAEVVFTAKSGTIAVPNNAYFAAVSISCQETVAGTASFYGDEIHAYLVA